MDMSYRRTKIISRWTEYCSKLYNDKNNGDNAVLNCSQSSEEDLQPILRKEIEITVAAGKKKKNRLDSELGGGTTEQIFNLRILCEKDRQHKICAVSSLITGKLSTGYDMQSNGLTY